ncbi:MAG: polysaccharide deacetylase family protein [Pirellulales bacterium]|nr:polysaccharide deacetylase family protein [Pirellulales bacterium]
MTTSLIVSIDTEEEGLWGGRFETQPTTKNLRGLERFQTFCEDREVVPTYLIDAPVLADAWAVERLRGWQEADGCEVGSHCHPWCNPPLEEKPISDHNSYLCNLDGSLQRQKLEWLTTEIEQRIGRRPTSFRAGRYGMDHVGAQILADLGYLVDSSVLPFRNYASQGGPDYRNATTEPYRIHRQSLLQSDPGGTLLEVPITSGYTGSGFQTRNRIQRLLSETAIRHTRLPGILDRLNLLRWVKLSPEQTAIDDAKKLVNAAIKQQAGVLVLMFHSSSLCPGHSPYVNNENELEQFYRWLDEVIQHCLAQKMCQSVSLTRFAEQWLQDHPTPSN